MKRTLYIFLFIIFLASNCISCKKEKKQEYVDLGEQFDLGEGYYRPTPFHLDNIPPFSWMGMPDSVKKETSIEIDFNEDAVRSRSYAQIAFVDLEGNVVDGIAIGTPPKHKFEIHADTLKNIVPVSISVDPAVKDTILRGSIVILGTDLDDANGITLSSSYIPIAKWTFTHNVGINWWRWTILILIVAIVICLFVLTVYYGSPFIAEGVGYISGLKLGAHIPAIKHKINNRGDTKKRKKDDKKDKNQIIKELKALEKMLYSPMSVSDKYDTLEKMRFIIDRLYNSDRNLYTEAKNELQSNTWEALEEGWKLWDPTPKRNVEWIGLNQQVCSLNSTHSLYKECESLNFLQCTYDKHGSPNFNPVTYPGSIVDISNLYDTLSSDNIQKRGGGKNSFQEIAQEQMARQLKYEINLWAKQNNCAPDFYLWRNAHNLVPHEDTNCRTMRLVNRDAHTAFKHRGGVANAINIKRHFP